MTDKPWFDRMADRLLNPEDADLGVIEAQQVEAQRNAARRPTPRWAALVAARAIPSKPTDLTPAASSIETGE
jgi:hypothetical protein